MTPAQKKALKKFHLKRLEDQAWELKRWGCEDYEPHYTPEAFGYDDRADRTFTCLVKQGLLKLERREESSQRAYLGWRTYYFVTKWYSITPKGIEVAASL